MTDNIQDLIRHLGQLAVAHVPSADWETITVVSRNLVTFGELDASYLAGPFSKPVFYLIEDDDLDYEEQATPSFEQLRRLMHGEAPFKGAWYTAELRITRNGDFNIEFEYDEPSFSIDVPEEDFVADFQEFPRDEESTPPWLKEIVQRNGLAYHPKTPSV